ARVVGAGEQHRHRHRLLRNRLPARPGRTLGDPAAHYLEVIANERNDYYLASGEAPGAGSVPGLSGSA
ncbi:MAG TPA: hypothetical protein PKX25_04040, partial [Microthrixaceae bacterium]|nr:hypothetical protein [Microthrixaceae bacterium]